jgi:hypothetical protein
MAEQENKPWYLSRGVMGGLVAMAIGVATVFGIEGMAGEKEALTEVILGIATALAGALAAYGRIKAKGGVKLKMLPIFLAIGLLTCGCGDRTLNAWLMTGQRTDASARLGTDIADGVEAGIAVDYERSSAIDSDEEPTRVGPYFVLTASWLIEQEDTGPAAPPPINWLANLVAVPYVGGTLMDYVDNERFGNLRPTWIMGTKFLLDPDGRAGITVEYWDSDIVPTDVAIGGFAKF